MYASTSFNTQLVHNLLVESNTRRLLFQNPLHSSAAAAPTTNTHNNSTDSSYFGDRDFDANVVMILAVLLCALICSLGLNSIIRCALRCSNVVINSDNNSSSNSSSPPLANKGIKKKALKTFPTASYSTELKLPGLDTQCVICITEFTNGEKVRILPKCNHGFHVRCIDKWLSAHSSCPTCRHCLIETCHKIVGSQPPPVTVLPVPETVIRIQPLEAPQPPPVLPVTETVIRIQPLEPERLERSYREVSS